MSFVTIAACTSAIEQLNEPQVVTPPVVVKNPAQTPAVPVTKDAKLLTPGTQVNDYVNKSLPSQLPHTVHQLNANPSSSAYPVIKDVPEPEKKLKTLEERRKLEEELRKLSPQPE